MTAVPKTKDALTEEEVLAYLRKHPDILEKNTDLLLALKAPQMSRGEGVIDLGQQILKALQKKYQELSKEHELLVDSCRSNLYAQAGIHQAIIDLFQLEEPAAVFSFLAQDLQARFGLDVVRLCLESDVGPEDGLLEPMGVSFLPTGTIDELLGEEETLLYAEIPEEEAILFSAIMGDETGMLVRSCAILKLHLGTQEGLLLLGSREAKRYHPSQGTELLGFFGKALTLVLAPCLPELMAQASK